jgi:hypothetical protein
MKRVVFRHAGWALLICLLLCVQSFAADRDEIVGKARSSYYSLAEQGLKSFQCTVVPDWKGFFAYNFKTLPDEQRMKLISRVQLAATINDKLHAAVMPITADSGEIDKSLDRLVGGLQETISGFYQSWVPMVVTNPVPAAAENFTLEQKGDEYRVLMKDGASDSEMALTKDYVISMMKVDGKDLHVVMWPKFTRTDKGLLLTSMDSSIDNGAMKVFFDIRYEEVDGFKLPRHVVIKVLTTGQQLIFEADFIQYRVYRKI